MTEPTTPPPDAPAPLGWLRWLDLAVVVPALGGVALMAHAQNWAAFGFAVAFLSHYVTSTLSNRSVLDTNHTIISTNTRATATVARLLADNDALARELRQVRECHGPHDLQFTVEGGSTCGTCGQRAAADLILNTPPTGPDSAPTPVARCRHCAACGACELVEGNAP
ncbi:hypothetical protein [Nocardiopsis dassonvillei]|uniref:hypothetical protein n=1 Tax=Nocardiopsis dassonvillei TaxID=2014 RepID=UPI00363F982F